MNSTDWYLEVNGSKTGPFTLEQLRGLVQEGEVPAHQKVTSDHLSGRWISIEEALSPGPVSTKEFVPPPRPTHLMSSPSPSPASSHEAIAAGGGEKTDPTIGLFAALQSVREKKGGASRYVPPPSGTLARESLSDRVKTGVFDFLRSLRGNPRKAAIFAGAVVFVLGFFIWLLV